MKNNPDLIAVALVEQHDSNPTKALAALAVRCATYQRQGIDVEAVRTRLLTAERCYLALTEPTTPMAVAAALAALLGPQEARRYLQDKIAEMGGPEA